MPQIVYNKPGITFFRQSGDFFTKFSAFLLRVKRIKRDNDIPGREGEALLRRGINAFFSFGAAIINNHKLAQASCAALPLNRLLFETDAPYIPPQGKTFSSWPDLEFTYQTAAKLRSKPVPPDLIAENFYRAFGI